MPQKWFSSPFKRCGETCGLEWGWAFGDSGEEPATEADLGHGVPAVVVEVSLTLLANPLTQSRKTPSAGRLRT